MALVAIGLIATVPAAPAISLSVTPSVGFSPLRVRVTVILGVPVEEQFVCVEIADLDSTCLQHDSSQQGSQRTIEIKNVPAGEWKVYASIETFRRQVIHRSAPATLIVRANAGEDD